MDNFWTNYLANVCAGLTLGLLGVGGYTVIKFKWKNTVSQKNERGLNIAHNSGPITITANQESSDDIIRKNT